MWGEFCCHFRLVTSKVIYPLKWLRKILWTYRKVIVGSHSQLGQSLLSLFLHEWYQVTYSFLHDASRLDHLLEVIWSVSIQQKRHDSWANEVHLSVSLSVCLSVSLSVCLSVDLPVCLPVCLPVRLSICPSVLPFIHLKASQPDNRLCLPVARTFFQHQTDLQPRPYPTQNKRMLQTSLIISNQSTETQMTEMSGVGDKGNWPTMSH